MNKINQAANLSEALRKNSDMSSRENEILREIVELTGFIYEKNIWRSKYWGKNLGASHWLGDYKGKKTVLKIQGVKPDISEIFMINEFSKQNKSKLIRPPDIYINIPWNDSAGYEAIITDYASGENVIINGKLVTNEKVITFFNYYSEYRKNCIPRKPWLSKSEADGNLQKVLDVLISTSMKAYPESELRIKDDFELAKKAYSILLNVYKSVELEFIHGHFSCKDLIFRNKNNDSVVLFSNLFWKWRYPYFDAVFAYHWFMYELSNVKNITPDKVENQRKIWLDEIYKVTRADNSKKIRNLVNAALLERSVAGFIIDSFLCDPKKSISIYLYESTKDETKRLIRELQQ